MKNKQKKKILISGQRISMKDFELFEGEINNKDSQNLFGYNNYSEDEESEY